MGLLVVFTENTPLLSQRMKTKNAKRRTKVAICTLFRDCVDDVHNAFTQRATWNDNKFDILHICLEGDSTDHTYDTIVEYKKRFNIELIKHDTGKPHYPSQAIPDRLQTLGMLSNIVLECAASTNVSYIVWMDSDITVPPDYIDRLVAHQKDVVAPMFYFEKSIFFRDTWGYRLGETEFTNGYPYCPAYCHNRLFEVDSVGLPCIKKSVIKAGARFGKEEIVDLCRSIRSLGFQIFIDPTLAATHPRHGIIIPAQYEIRDGRRNTPQQSTTRILI